MWSSPLVSAGHEIVARMWQFPQLLPFLAHQSSHLMNMVIMGNHSINGARSKLLVVFTQISTTIAAHLIQSHPPFQMDFWIKSDYFSATKEFFNDPSCL